MRVIEVIITAMLIFTLVYMIIKSIAILEIRYILIQMRMNAMVR